LFAQPGLELDEERPAALAAGALPLLRRQAVDLLLDGNSASIRCTASIAIGALASRARSKNLRRACAQQAASKIGPGLRPGS
jgi:hypothetical protein